MHFCTKINFRRARAGNEHPTKALIVVRAVELKHWVSLHSYHVGSFSRNRAKVFSKVLTFYSFEKSKSLTDFIDNNEVQSEGIAPLLFRAFHPSARFSTFRFMSEVFLPDITTPFHLTCHLSFGEVPQEVPSFFAKTHAPIIFWLRNHRCSSSIQQCVHSCNVIRMAQWKYFDCDRYFVPHWLRNGSLDLVGINFSIDSFNARVSISLSSAHD